MMTRKTKKDRKRCVIGIGEVNVIIRYIIPQTFVITKYSFFWSKLLLNIHQLFLHQIYGNFMTDFQTI